MVNWGGKPFPTFVIGVFSCNDNDGNHPDVLVEVRGEWNHWKLLTLSIHTQLVFFKINLR